MPRESGILFSQTKARLGIVCPANSKAAAAERTTKLELEPVSYTHLDVYKRQQFDIHIYLPILDLAQ